MRDFSHCKENIELLSLLAEGELHGEEAEALRAHAAACPVCAERLAAFSAFRGALQGDFEQAPEQFAAGVIAAVKAERRRRRRTLMPLGLVAAAAVVVVVLFGGDRLMNIAAGNSAFSDKSLSGALAAPESGRAQDDGGENARDTQMTTKGGDSFYGVSCPPPASPAPAPTSVPGTAASGFALPGSLYLPAREILVCPAAYFDGLDYTPAATGPDGALYLLYADYQGLVAELTESSPDFSENAVFYTAAPLLTPDAAYAAVYLTD